MDAKSEEAFLSANTTNLKTTELKQLLISAGVALQMRTYTKSDLLRLYEEKKQDILESRKKDKKKKRPLDSPKTKSNKFQSDNSDEEEAAPAKKQNVTATPAKFHTVAQEESTPTRASTSSTPSNEDKEVQPVISPIVSPQVQPPVPVVPVPEPQQAPPSASRSPYRSRRSMAGEAPETEEPRGRRRSLDRNGNVSDLNEIRARIRRRSLERQAMDTGAPLYEPTQPVQPYSAGRIRQQPIQVPETISQPVFQPQQPVQEVRAPRVESVDDTRKSGIIPPWVEGVTAVLVWFLAISLIFRFGHYGPWRVFTSDDYQGLYPCPANGVCENGFLTCNDGYEQRGTECVESSVLSESFHGLVEDIAQLARLQQGKHQCGQVESPFITRDDVQKLEGRFDLFDQAYAKAKEELKASNKYGVVYTKNDGVDQFEADPSSADFPIECLAQQLIQENIQYVALSLLLFGVAIWGYSVLQRKAAEDRESQEVYNSVVSLLQQAQGRQVPITQVRDSVFHSPFGKKKESVWRKVESFTERNSNITKGISLAHGEQQHTWEWTGPIPVMSPQRN